MKATLHEAIQKGVFENRTVLALYVLAHFGWSSVTGLYGDSAVTLALGSSTLLGILTLLYPANPAFSKYVLGLFSIFHTGVLGVIFVAVMPWECISQNPETLLLHLPGIVHPLMALACFAYAGSEVYFGFKGRRKGA